MRKWKLIIYIPAYNAESTLPELLKRFRKIENTLDSLGVQIKSLIIVNDGSTDGTVEIIKKHMEHMPYLRLVDKKKNEGPAAAVFDGMREAARLLTDPERSIILRMDSDLEHQPEDLKRLIDPIISGKTKISVGFIPLDSRSGMLTKWFNEYIGLNESRRFLDKDIPQFCPGFNAFRSDLFSKLYPLLKEKNIQFKKQYGEDMLTMDFVILMLAKEYGEEINVLKLSPIEKQWLRKPPIRKILYYLIYHRKTVEFLRKNMP